MKSYSNKKIFQMYDSTIVNNSKHNKLNLLFNLVLIFSKSDKPR